MGRLGKSNCPQTFSKVHFVGDEMTMLRVLMLTARLPYPIDDGWKIRTYHLIKGWNESGAQVDLISFVHPEESGSRPQGFSDLCGDIRLVPREKSYAWSDLFKGLVSKIPFTIYNYSEPQMHYEVDQMLADRKYDIIQVEDIVMAQYLPVADLGVIRILDMHNIESHLLERYAKNEPNFLKKIFALLTSRKLRSYEVDACKLFDKVLICSDEDKNILQQCGIGVPLEVLPNGVDCEYFCPPEKNCEANDLVFVGSMDYHANISGVLYFVHNVFPLILRRHPETLFIIVGKNPPEIIQNLANDHILVTGMVPDVRPYLARARVVVVPLLVGGGTRLKILEAMAWGRPIVATSLGAEGIKASHGENILLADTPPAFAEHVVDLLGDSDKCRKIGRVAREFVMAFYAWNILTDRLSVSVRDSLEKK